MHSVVISATGSMAMMGRIVVFDREKTKGSIVSGEMGSMSSGLFCGKVCDGGSRGSSDSAIATIRDVGEDDVRAMRSSRDYGITRKAC
jgi:hypothetical protein